VERVHPEKFDGPYKGTMAVVVSILMPSNSQSIGLRIDGCISTVYFSQLAVALFTVWLLDSVWQPLPCPFCDRIFKQDGRLKEHLKNKHADEENQESAEAVEGGQIEQQPASTSEPVQNPQRDEHGYPIKSPKTLLHEWCQKNKKPQPKFKAVSDSILVCSSSDDMGWTFKSNVTVEVAVRSGASLDFAPGSFCSKS